MDKGATAKGEGGSSLSRKGPNYIYITPLFLTALPLIRIAFKNNPPLRNKLFYGAVAVGLCHGAWLIARTGEDEEEEAYAPMPPRRRQVS
jgi:hypothetical protein